MKYLLLDEAGDTAAGGASGYEATKTDDKGTETAGNNGDTNKENAQGAQDQSAKSGDQSKQAAEDKSKENVSGYDLDEEDTSTPPPAADENKDAKKEDEDKGKEEENKTKVEDLKIDLRGLSEDQTKDLIEFAKELNLSNEQAQKVLDKRKSELDKFNEHQQEFDKQVKEVYQSWGAELKKEWGKEFNTNIHAVNQTLTNHFPETAKLLASSGKRLNPKQMKEYFNLSQILKDEGQHNGGDGGGKEQKERKPWDAYSN